jgi:hypothetical protein
MGRLKNLRLLAEFFKFLHYTFEFCRILKSYYFLTEAVFLFQSECSLIAIAIIAIASLFHCFCRVEWSGVWWNCCVV